MNTKLGIYANNVEFMAAKASQRLIKYSKAMTEKAAQIRAWLAQTGVNAFDKARRILAIHAAPEVSQPPAPSARAFRSRSQWKLVPGDSRQSPIAQSRSWSHYERLTFVLLGWMWVALLGITLALHIGNYGLETRTSSTSGTHMEFYDLKGVGESESNNADGEETNDAQP